MMRLLDQPVAAGAKPQDQDDTSPSLDSLPQRNARLRSALKRHLGFVWRSLRRLGVEPRDADDAAQEVFLVLSRRLADVPEPKEQAFLFGTLQRVASTYRRGRRRRPESLLGSEEELVEQPEHPWHAGFGPEATACISQERQLLEEALNTMTDEQRVVFSLYELEELTVPVIAELLGETAASITSRLRRARETFARFTERLQRQERRR